MAAAGPIVLAADGRIAHAGIAVPEGIPLPLLHGERASMDDHFGYGTSAYNVSAVDGALMTPRATFEQLGGLRIDAGTATLADYCMRAGDELGGRSVTIGDARLQLVGVDPMTNNLGSIRRFAERWRERGDPYYNAALRSDRGDFVPLG